MSTLVGTIHTSGSEVYELNLIQDKSREELLKDLRTNTEKIEDLRETLTELEDDRILLLAHILVKSLP